MYVFCVYPAMSKKSENLSDNYLNKKDRNKTTVQMPEAELGGKYRYMRANTDI
jgi:hypothetical protein